MLNVCLQTEVDGRGVGGGGGGGSGAKVTEGNSTAPKSCRRVSSVISSS